MGWILLKHWEIILLPTFLSTKFSVLVALIELLEDFIVLISEVKYPLLVFFSSSWGELTLLCLHLCLF